MVYLYHSRLRGPCRRRSERQKEPRMMDNFKETVFSRQKGKIHVARVSDIHSRFTYELRETVIACPRST